MMDPPIVSIVTPTFHNNDHRSFQRMLSSVSSQTFAMWEHIVCSDGLVEEATQRAVNDGGDQRRRYVASSVHHGGWGAGVRDEVMRNHATGKYLVFLDDDNIIFPNYLQRMLEALRCNPAARFAICTILHCGPVQLSIGTPPLYLRGEPKLYHIDTMQIMVEADAMRSVGWVSPQHYCSDGMTYEKLGATFPYARVEQCLGVHL